jgi:hypothetical protein
MRSCTPQIHRRIEKLAENKFVPSGLEYVTFCAEEQLGRHEKE